MRINKISLIVLFIVSFLLMGCPYATELELSGAKKVEDKYIGTYEKQSSSYYYLKVSKSNETMYKLEKYRTKTDEVSQTGLGYIIDIGGTHFLIAKAAGSSYSYSKNKSYIYKITSKADGLAVKIQGITDYLDEEFETEAELKAYISNYKNLSFFYQKKAEKYFKTDGDW